MSKNSRRDHPIGSEPSPRRTVSMPAVFSLVRRSAGVLLLLLASPFALGNRAPVKQTIYIDGGPARHTSVSLYDCTNGSLYRGPVSTADDGSVTFPDVDDGVYCERADIAAGYASRKIRIDTTIQNQRVDVNEIVPHLSLVDGVVSVAFCLFTLLLVIYPIGRYLAKPWAFRRDTLIGQLSGDPMRLYYRQFHSGEMIPNISAQGDKKSAESKPVGDPALQLSDYEAAFRRHFNKWHGRRYYIAPVAGLAVLTAVSAWWGCANLWLWISGLRSIESMYGLAAAAIAGGLVWIISDEIDRLRRRDFTSSDVYYYVFRLLLAVPFAWALTRIQMTLQVGIPIAFFLGAFPTSTLFTAARRIANQQLKLGDDPASGNLELEKLQSIGKQGAERFKDEGISTISQLAYSDPVDLTIRTNFDFNYVTDCVSQALLWIYLGDQLQNLAIFSLRGAYEANCLIEDLAGPNPANAQKTLADIVAVLVANKIQISAETLETTLRQAGQDPYTEFLVDIWK